MFKRYADYVKAAMEALKDKPQGTGYSNGTGVVFVLNGALCYVEEGQELDDAREGDISAWEENSNRNEFDALQSPVFVERFSPEEVEAYEAGL
jgi:hypothetical protein